MIYQFIFFLKNIISNYLLKYMRNHSNNFLGNRIKKIIFKEIYLQFNLDKKYKKNILSIKYVNCFFFIYIL